MQCGSGVDGMVIGVEVVGVLVPVVEVSSDVEGGVDGVVSVAESAAGSDLAARLAAAVSCFLFVSFAKCLQICSRFGSVRSGNGNEI